MKNNLRILMAKRRINMSQLSKDTGIARATISKIYNESSKRIDLTTIQTLCDYFDCGIDDLFIKNKH